jgi:hypothetical protein
VGPPGPGTTKRGLRSRAHTACAGFRSADSTRRVFLLLLSGAVSCCCCCSCCLSRRCCSRSARAAEILAAHRCSHLLSRSSGILLTTKAPGSRSPPGQRPQRARAFKVQSEGIKLFLQSRGLRAGAPCGGPDRPAHGPPTTPGLTSGLARVVVGLTPDYGRKAGLNRVSTGAYSSDVRAATNFRGAEKSRFWLGS